MTNTAFPGLCAEQTNSVGLFEGGVWLRGFIGLFRDGTSSLLCKLSKLFNWYRSVELTYLWPAMYWTCLRLWFLASRLSRLPGFAWDEGFQGLVLDGFKHVQ